MNTSKSSSNREYGLPGLQEKQACAGGLGRVQIELEGEGAAGSERPPAPLLGRVDAAADVPQD